MRSDFERMCAIVGVIRIRHIDNLAANLERYPLFAGTSGSSFPLRFVLFVQYAGEPRNLAHPGRDIPVEYRAFRFLLVVND